MPLSAVMDSIDDLADPLKELYTEKNGRYELTGITGVFTQGNIDRLQTALNKERGDHAKTKESLSVWGEMSHEDVIAKLDRIPELEAAAAGKLDEAAIEDIVTRRVDGTVKTKTAPLERSIAQLTKDNAALKEENEAFRSENRKRIIGDAVRESLVKGKVLTEAQEDALLLAERVFEITEDGVVLTKDQVGVTPGVAPDVWLQEMQERRPHWWPASNGGGARGGNTGGGMAENPWSKDHWNLTKQGQVMREKGSEKAAQLAKAAGSRIGATRAPA